MVNGLKSVLKEKLTKEELKKIPSSFDIVGNILIFSDFPADLAEKEKVVGEEIIKNFKHVKSVFKKSEKYSGKYRTPKLKLLSGEGNKETTHRENNVSVKLNVEKTYFSPRLSSERKRISQAIKKNESILVMFSGVGIFPVTIAKNNKPKEVYGIEANPIAHKFALENLRLNKVEERTKLFLGDVRKIIPKTRKKFDRILMPLPKDAEGFLDLALGKIKRKGIIHFYTFGKVENYNSITKNISKICEKSKKKCKILRIVKCGHFSPGTFRICVDFRVG